MNGRWTKAVFAMAGFALALALAIGGARAQSGAAQSPAAGFAPKMAEEVYKNIQVLKGVPADQLVPTMQFFAASLGVDCEFCHDQRARELDIKDTKQTARRMMEMVFTINKNTFEGQREVTCYTCHRGSSEPVGMPLVAGQELQPEPAGARETDQLLDKYVAALGGADAIRKISSRVEKVTVTDAAGRKFPVEVFAKAPDKRLSVTHLAEGDNIAVYNGGAGWLRAGAGQPRDMMGAELDAARLEDTFYFAGRVKQVVEQLRLERTEKIGDREAYVIFGRTQSLPLVKLYFDRESGMLVRLVHYTETAVGRIPVQIDYADYRNADGVKIPFRWTIAQVRGRRFTYQIDQVQQNIPIEESKFAKPSAPAASGQNPPAR